MTPFHADEHLTLWQGDARAVMAELEPESVHCVVTSPPYWGLRDYGIPPTVWGGLSPHDHAWGEEERGKRSDMLPSSSSSSSSRNGSDDRQGVGPPTGGRLCDCGAWLGALGLEPTPGLFVEHLIELFREVRRILRKDGTVWLNLGDSYASHDPGDRRDGRFLNPEGRQYDKGRRSGPAVRNRAGIYGRVIGLKPKDRVMIPARVALALQADGWWLRDEIVWAKPNPMPSSVEDRTTPAHEMVYLLTKSRRYWYDAEAIREGRPEHELRRDARGYRTQRHGGAADGAIPPGSTQHSGFATGRLGGSVRREVHGKQAATADARASGGDRWSGFNDRWTESGELRVVDGGSRNKRSVWTVATEPYPEAHFATFPTKLIEPMILAGCPVGGTVLDPFGGSGTVAVVAQALGRKAVLIDLSADYCAQAMRRIGRARGRGDGPAVDMPIPAPSGSLWEAAG